MTDQPHTQIASEVACALESLRTTHPLVHCITNYVTVNDCANALLALDASPIMSDEEDDVADITAICNALTLNIGTLNKQTIRGMEEAAMHASELSHAIVLDPVGAGASKLRTSLAAHLLDAYRVSIIRGNMSEIKALVGASATTRGVDVNPADAVTQETIPEAADFARQVAHTTGCIVAITGAIDIVADSERAFAVQNGSALQGRITGAGCMLSCTTAAFAAANENKLIAALAAVVSMGVAGEVAQARMTPECGNGSFRTYLLDALFNQTPDQLLRMAKITEA